MFGPRSNAGWWFPPGTHIPVRPRSASGKLRLLAAEPITERNGIVPAHVDHWVIVALRKSRLMPSPLRFLHQYLSRWISTPSALSIPLAIGCVTRVGNKLTELANRHFATSQEERSGNPYPMLRYLMRHGID